MAMNLTSRLRALERVVLPADDCCPACGYAPGSRLDFVMSFGDEADEGPDVCPTCGRALVIRLTFDDVPEITGA